MGSKMESKLNLSKRGQSYSEIPNVVMLFIMAAIVGSVGVLILGSFKDADDASSCYAWEGGVAAGNENCTATYFNDTVGYGIGGIKELLSWTDTIAIIFVAVILIAAIMLFGRSRRV